MKKIIFLILAVFIILSYSSRFSYAVMSEEASAETLLNTIVQERYKAEQEYHIYKAQKAAQPAPTAPVPAKSTSGEAVYAKVGKDVIIGIVLIIVAIVLTIRLYKMSKQKQKP